MNFFKRKYKASMPYILNEITDRALRYNKERTVFDKAYRCIAFAFDGSRLLDYGININKTNPNFRDYAEINRLTTHAEISLIMQLAKKDMIKRVTDIVIIRGTSKLLDSHPCDLCYAHLIDTFNNVRLWYYINSKWEMKIV